MNRLRPLLLAPSLLAPSLLALALLALPLLALARPAAAATPVQQRGASTAILMEGFDWTSSNTTNPNWYQTLATQTSTIQSLGVTHVWLPPPSDSLAAQGYLPRKLDDFTSAYGTQAQLQSIISSFLALGIHPIVDTVINHRVGTSNAYAFTDPSWPVSTIVSNDECNCGTGAPDSGWGYSAARDLDHTSVTLQNGIVTWMRKLTALGFTGLRYDYAPGYRAEIQAGYTQKFAPDLCVDEVWTTLSLNAINAHRTIEQQYITGDGTPCANSADASCGTGNGQTCGAFDFTTHGLLVEALTNNDYNVLKDVNGTDPAGLIGIDPAMAVTFVDNQDTGPAETCTTGQNLWPVPCGSVMQAYAYILTHPGIPTIFYPHVFYWNLQTPIAALVAARKLAGITSTSAVTIQQATTGLYAAMIAGTAHTLAMKIGPNSWQPGAGWSLQTSGNDYAVWMK